MTIGNFLSNMIQLLIIYLKINGARNNSAIHNLIISAGTLNAIGKKRTSDR